MILDGAGDGFRVKVCREKRLFTTGEDFTGSLIATISGFTFSFASGAITLTSANPSALLYVKNNSDIHLIIESVRFQAFDSTGGAGGIPTWTLLKNPTSGTIISGGTVANPSNANFGSQNTVDVDLIRGAEGLTFTDGTVHANIFGDRIPGRVTIENAEFCVPRGSSVGLRVTPPAGNTLWTVSAGFRGYYSTSLDQI
jgi:hypothetical protein